MPLLPNLGDIPQAQFDRIVAVFPGSTATEKADNYRAWLTNRLIDFVEAQEIAKINQQFNAQRQAAITEVRASLPARREEPPYLVT
jgi:uncharacterized protein (DUF1499 family)